MGQFPIPTKHHESPNSAGLDSARARVRERREEMSVPFSLTERERDLSYCTCVYLVALPFHNADRQRKAYWCGFFPICLKTLFRINILPFAWSFFHF